jgi:hypothetical protein
MTMRGPVLPDDAAESNTGGGDSGASEDVDVCSLLEQADIEAEFGDRWSVTQESSGCDWQVGEFGRSGTGTVNVVNTRTFGPIEEDYDIAWDVADHPVAMEAGGTRPSSTSRIRSAAVSSPARLLRQSHVPDRRLASPGASELLRSGGRP